MGFEKRYVETGSKKRNQQFYPGQRFIYRIAGKITPGDELYELSTPIYPHDSSVRRSIMATGGLDIQISDILAEHLEQAPVFSSREARREVTVIPGRQFLPVFTNFAVIKSLPLRIQYIERT
jgi:hypothetical protein